MRNPESIFLVDSLFKYDLIRILIIKIMQQQVQIFENKHHALKLIFSSHEKKMTIRHHDYALELTEPPSCDTLKNKFRNVRQFFNFLTQVPLDRILVVRGQYLIVQSNGQLIINKLKPSNNLFEIDHATSFIQAKNSPKQAATYDVLTKSCGFQAQSNTKYGNCIGMMLSIYREKHGSKRYFSTYNTCYLVAFNVAIFSERQKKYKDFQLEYSSMLVSSFEHEAKRFLAPVVEYGSINQIIYKDGINVCQISPSSSFFQKVGYLSLKLFNFKNDPQKSSDSIFSQADNIFSQAAKYQVFDYQKAKNQQQFGAAFWNYNLYYAEVGWKDASSGYQIIVLGNQLLFSAALRGVMRAALSFIKNLQCKGLRHLFSNMFKLFDSIHRVNIIRTYFK